MGKFQIGAIQPSFRVFTSGAYTIESTQGRTSQWA